jgi:argininosuccinate lyase
MSRGGLFASGGRFASAGLDPVMEKFNASIQVDKRLFGEDIEGSIQWSVSLVEMKIISPEERVIMKKGLEDIRGEWETGKFVIQEMVRPIRSSTQLNHDR